MSPFKNRFASLLAASTAMLALESASGVDKPAAVFEGQDTLLRPDYYREWVFVGSSIGVRYNQEPDKAAANHAGHFNNVYINPAAYREFVRSGKFPEGT